MPSGQSGGPSASQAAMLNLSVGIALLRCWHSWTSSQNATDTVGLDLPNRRRHGGALPSCWSTVPSWVADIANENTRSEILTFPELHHQGTPFVLPNAWDVPSALAYIEDGFTAIGTTSFGVASNSGHPDGGRATRETNLTLATALVRLPCYVSVDIEDGYSDDPEAVADYVAHLPVAGINVEDSSAEVPVDPSLAAAKITATKRRNPDVFINARVDTYWLNQNADPETTIKRANAYVEAGADGIFVPMCNDRMELADVVSNISVPVNTLPVPGLTLAELGELGVARVSTGSMPYGAGLHAAALAARAVRDGQPVPPSTPYPELQARLIGYENRTNTA
jgi:2-methylisocitrate lyase-like PEP mutase family enzyme